MVYLFLYLPTKFLYPMYIEITSCNMLLVRNGAFGQF